MPGAATSRTLLILGATAAGKSALALELAQRRRAEIVSLDSMQVYRGMDIGTAKPSPAERRLVPHHLVDVLDVAEHSDVAAYLDRVRRAEQAAAARGARPILVGGTAMYIKALVDGLFEGPAASAAIRAELLATADEHGSAYLHEHVLKPVDSATAARVHPNDLRRIVRAIEVFRLTGRPLSEHQRQWDEQDAQCAYAMAGLTMPRDELYRRIDARVDAMMAAGLLDEVDALRAKGIEQNPSAAQAIGYKELLAHLRGECDCARAVELIKRNTRRFAKHQLTWFRKDRRISWFDVTLFADAAKLADAVEEWLEGGAAMTSAPPERLK